jgi:uncharacterized delta-60 repeat protein
MRNLDVGVIFFIGILGAFGCKGGDPDGTSGTAGGGAGGPTPGDGVLDPSWGGDGSVEGRVDGDEAAINGIDVQPDGRIVAAMRIAGTGNAAAPALFRFLPDGTPDPAFGSDGAVLVPPGPGPDYLSATLVQPDGKILAAGSLSKLLQAPEIILFDPVLLRFEADGSVDTTFGDQGRAVFEPSAGEVAVALSLDADGSILVVVKESSSAALTRFLPDGSLDTAYGVSGVATLDVRNPAIAVQSDGRLIIAGEVAGNPDTEYGVRRYARDGTLDVTFGDAGVVLFGKLTSDYPGASVAVAKDDSIVVGYPLLSDGLVSYDMVLERLSPGGAPDASFGEGGRVVHNAADQDHVRALAVQDDGSVLAAGTLGPGALKSAANLTRFRPDGTVDPDFAKGGAYTVADSFSQLNAVRILLNGGIFVAGETSSSYIAACYLP